MGRFSFEDAEHYGGGGNQSFFQLKDDKDTARVRIMYNDMRDAQGLAVHQVEIDGKKRYVNCLRDYNEPIDACPFCAARISQQAKLFVPLYDVDADAVRIWERGKKFFSQLSGLCNRYNPLVSTIVEIERNGKKGDQATTYALYPGETDDTRIEDLPEIEDVLGSIVLDKTADEMEYYLDYGNFPNGDANGGRRNSGRDREEVTRRGSDRVPARRGRDEAF